MATAIETGNLLQDAALVVDVCMSVEDGDVVTIICDDEHSEHAAAVAELVVDRGGWPVVMNNEAQVRRGRADVRFPMAPPANLHRAMVGSDEVIIITNLEWANRFAHVNAVRETCEANGKIASVEPGMGSWDLTVEDIKRATERAQDAMAGLEGKKQVHVTTPRGSARRSRASRTPTSSASSPSARARRRRSAPPRRRGGSGRSTSRWATTTTPIRAGRTTARSTSTASS